MLRARMGIRAHPTLTKRKTSKGPNWHPVLRLRRADRSSISSFHLADLGGEACRYLTFHFPLLVGCQVKPFPRSHRRSLAQSTRIGERGWRRGRASIPLVNLSERVLCGIGRDPWLVVAATGEYRPSNACELVGERNGEQIAMR